MARVTPEQATDKWVTRLSGAGQQIRDGVNNVQVAPGQRAAAAADLWVQRVTSSRDKWKARVGAVSLGQWQTAMIEVGIPRIASGAQAKRGKMQDFMASFLPWVDQGVAKVKAMPKGDINASIARSTAMIMHNAAFKR